MGLRYLQDLRDFLKENKDQEFSRTELRDKLKQNYPTIIANLKYLIETEELVWESEEKPLKYQWRK